MEGKSYQRKEGKKLSLGVLLPNLVLAQIRN